MFTSGSEGSPAIPTSHIQHSRLWDFGGRFAAIDSGLQGVPADPTPVFGMSQFYITWARVTPPSSTKTLEAVAEW